MEREFKKGDRVVVISTSGVQGCQGEVMDVRPGGPEDLRVAVRMDEPTPARGQWIFRPRELRLATTKPQLLFYGRLDNLMKTLEELAIVAPLEDGRGFLVVLPQPFACACGRAAAIAINRDGKTRCLSCDEAYRKSLES